MKELKRIIRGIGELKGFLLALLVPSERGWLYQVELYHEELAYCSVLKRRVGNCFDKGRVGVTDPSSLVYGLLPILFAIKQFIIISC